MPQKDLLISWALAAGFYALGAITSLPLLDQGRFAYWASASIAGLVFWYVFFAILLGWNPFKWLGK